MINSGRASPLGCMIDDLVHLWCIYEMSTTSKGVKDVQDIQDIQDVKDVDIKDVDAVDVVNLCGGAEGLGCRAWHRRQ